MPPTQPSRMITRSQAKTGASRAARPSKERSISRAGGSSKGRSESRSGGSSKERSESRSGGPSSSGVHSRVSESSESSESGFSEVVVHLPNIVIPEYDHTGISNIHGQISENNFTVEDILRYLVNYKHLILLQGKSARNEIHGGVGPAIFACPATWDNVSCDIPNIKKLQTRIEQGSDAWEERLVKSLDKAKHIVQVWNRWFTSAKQADTQGPFNNCAKDEWRKALAVAKMRGVSEGVSPPDYPSAVAQRQGGPNECWWASKVIANINNKPSSNRNANQSGSFIGGLLQGQR